MYAMSVHQIVYSRRGGRITPRGAELLRNLCIDTGGRSFEVHDERDLPAVAAKIGLEIRNEYLLGYRPANQNWDGKYRRITLKLIRSPKFPHLRGYWRRGYYAPQGIGP
jgi:Ca-activated chloride channel family protein